ncbi:diguanylate cyclase [Pseudomonas citronellolis]|uniref:diguanylate cyclase n=1 Tax=Pseudomonas citronellolis TaxID=53408 RepID=UPI0023E3E259|nr:diguanylate cyclase [Pseudomonas citronellolis]MDF3935857.1 diguanylate cyclase [Pseudomonas citronellolis]
MAVVAGKGLSFARRIYLPRMVGLGIGFFCVAAALEPLSRPLWAWLLLVGNGFLWPHLAYQVARHSFSPYHAERRNLLLDSLFGGFWAGAMQLNPLPSVTILSMMAMDNIAAGGLRFFLKGCVAQLLGVALAWMCFGVAFSAVATPLQVYACLPMLVIYPLAVGGVSFSLARRLSEHKQALRAVSRTDSLTGLLNHGSWMAQLESEFLKCRQQHTRGCVVLIDIDRFKDINDRFGHVLGDMVITELSRMLTHTLRESDTPGRYGGDEFCVILPGTTQSLAVEIMQRLRQSFANKRYELAPDLAVGLSIGVAPYSPYQVDASAWLNEADKALYRAKSEGRNRVLGAEPSVQPQ